MLIDQSSSKLQIGLLSGFVAKSCWTPLSIWNGACMQPSFCKLLNFAIHCSHAADQEGQCESFSSPSGRGEWSETCFKMVLMLLMCFKLFCHNHESKICPLVFCTPSKLRWAKRTTANDDLHIAKMDQLDVSSPCCRVLNSHRLHKD